MTFQQGIAYTMRSEMFTGYDELDMKSRNVYLESAKSDAALAIAYNCLGK